MGFGGCRRSIWKGVMGSRVNNDGSKQMRTHLQMVLVELQHFLWCGLVNRF